MFKKTTRKIRNTPEFRFCKNLNDNPGKGIQSLLK